ncbi:reverse transcriptase domain-containing protein, partial [Tanacetum coccineum]
MEKTYTWIKAREVTTNEASNDRRDNFKRSRKSSWDREVETDHGYDTNDCRQIMSQIEEAVRSSQLSHLVKGIKKERKKNSNSQRGEKKEKSTTPAEAPIPMINQEEASTRNNISKIPTFEGREITFPLPSIQASKVDSQVSLVGFLGGKSWPLEKETSSANTEGVLNYTDAEEKIIINSKYPEQTVTIGKQLPEHFKKRLRNILRTNADVFEWTHADMTGIPRTLRTAARKEVEEITRAWILWEAIHQTWVANLVMVDSLSGFRLKCFLDAYKGYHHIQMAEEDEDKTTFFVGEGVYCYRKMPFGLKNAGATYQRLVDKVFNDQIGRNIKAYVDDMVIKSTSEEDMLADIKETFQRKHKCRFIREKGKRTCSYLLLKQGPTGSQTQLPCTGKTHTSIGTHSEKDAKIFPGTYGSSPNQLL